MLRDYKVLNEVQLNLLEKNIIDLTDDIGNSMVLYVRESICRLVAKGNPDIEIWITSSGGSVGIGLDIYDFIRLYPGKKTGIIKGYAHSMAAVILQACDIRKSMEQSTILIHHVNAGSISLDQLTSRKKLKSIIEEMKADQKKLYQILIKRTGKSREEIIKKCKEDRDMTAKEAKEFGLIDEII